MAALVGVTAGRWRARPGLARACRVAAFVGPVVAATGVAYLAAQMLPVMEGARGLLTRWAMIAIIALAGAMLAERSLSWLTPMAALLELDIGFPSASPTRMRIASVASLRARDANLVDRSPGTAEHGLDGAAESVLISYAARISQGLQPRTHLERVRLLTMLLAD